MLFIAIAITLATGDPSFAVVPDYYQKAVGYDDRRAALAASEQLGWSVQLEPAPTADVRGQRDAVVRLNDREGRPVEGASVRIDCYHVSRAADPQTFELIEVLPGQYIGAAKMDREGFWQFDLSATRGDDVFVSDLRQFVRAPEGVR